MKKAIERLIGSAMHRRESARLLDDDEIEALLSAEEEAEKLKSKQNHPTALPPPEEGSS